jgi:transcriptional regulator with XRE-family HTH domain
MRNTMPTKAPEIADTARVALTVLGQRIRTQRKNLHISANVAAMAAGMSRVTLHRVERGEPSVTMGAYLNVMNALGLDIDLVTHSPGIGNTDLAQDVSTVNTTHPSLPPRLRVADYPQLQQLSWHIPGAAELTPSEAFGLYERNWRHLELEQMAASERELLKTLISTLGGGCLLV